MIRVETVRHKLSVVREFKMEIPVRCQSRLEKKTCLRSEFKKPNFGPWDFQGSLWTQSSDFTH